MERGRRALPPVPLVYVSTFGSHRCGSVIRLGRGCRQSPGQSPPGRAGAPRAVPEPRAGPSREPGGSGRRAGSGGEGRPGSRTPGDPQEAKTDTFDFPIPSRNVDKVIKRKKKKSKVWHKVWRVISKMLEENERFRSRLLSCSQFDEAGRVHLWLGVARKERKIQPQWKLKSSESFYFDLVLPGVSARLQSDFREHRFSVVCLVFVLLLFKRFVFTVA